MVASGASVRVEWMLRSHDVAYTVQEELKIKERGPDDPIPEDSKRLLLFLTVHEALAFCERGMIGLMGKFNAGLVQDRFSRKFPTEDDGSLAFVFSRILGSSTDEERTLKKLNSKRYHEEIEYHAGQAVFQSNVHSDAFYVVLKGSCAVAISPRDPRYEGKVHNHIVSGAGVVRHSGSYSNLLDPATQDNDPKVPLVFASVWPVGGVFGYVDCLLQRQRNFRAVATEPGTLLARISMAQLKRVQKEDPVLDGLIQRVLLQASLLDLANCTCDE